MAVVLLLKVAVGALGLWIVSTLLAAYRSPLNKIPNAHWSAPLSHAWLLWARGTGSETMRRTAAHRNLGPVIRIGPREISIASVEDGVQTVYGGNWDKAPLYDNFRNFDHPPLFAVREAKAHAERRRIYAQPFSKTTIDNSSDLRAVVTSLGDVLRSKLDLLAETGEVVNTLPMATAYATDIITAYLYGPGYGTQWLEDERKAHHHLGYISKIFGEWAVFAYTELSFAVEPLKWVGIKIVPRDVVEAHALSSSFFLNLTNSSLTGKLKPDEEPASVIVEQTFPTQLTTSSKTLQHMQEKLLGSRYPVVQQRAILACDLMDQVHAAQLTIGIVLTYALYELSRNPKTQTALRSELRTSSSPMESSLLEAILLETMRMYPATFTVFARVAPANGAKIAGFDIPGGTLAGASPYTLGRDANVFDQPERWLPSRWLSKDGEDEGAEVRRTRMKRYVWSFTSGPRVCIGKHIAIAIMQNFLVDTYTHFRTRIARESNMKQKESFLASPVDDALYIGLERV